MKKLCVAIILIITLMMSCLVGCGTVLNSSGDAELVAAKENAAAVFTLDVNPGVRIYVKEDDSVIAVEATNDDGETVVAELAVVGEDYQTAVELIIDRMDEKGFLEGEENSVLISVEKKEMEISEKVNEKIEKAFEKHGKRASVIEQELEGLGEEMEDMIGRMAEKYNISEGKAHLINKIREEFPELSEEELSKLKVNDLGMMLEETSEDIKGQFKKIGKAVETDYVGRQQAQEIALASVEGLELTAEDVTMMTVRITRGEGKMLYEVEFVYDGMEYEIIINAKTGEVLETECEEYEEFDPKEMIEQFCDRHDIDPEEIKDQIMNNIFGKGEDKGENPDEQTSEQPEEKPLTRGELLKGLLEELQITAETLKKTDVKLYETESGTVFAVTIESGEDVYMLVVEAYSGTVMKAELNGVEFELNAETAE